MKLSGDVVKRMNAAYANAYGTTMLTFGERHKAALTAAARVCIAAKDAEDERLRAALDGVKTNIQYAHQPENCGDHCRNTCRDCVLKNTLDDIKAALEAKHD